MLNIVFIGVNSFHAFMASRDKGTLSDADLYKMFRKCKQLNAIPMVHAENGCLIDEVILCIILTKLKL